MRYLEENSKDFIQFKASILMGEAKNDPIKKADLIRDMVASISKIPDRIQREVYIQECARIMDISEQVLVSTLAQLIQKDLSEANKRQKQEQNLLRLLETSLQNKPIIQEEIRKIREPGRPRIIILVIWDISKDLKK